MLRRLNPYSNGMRIELSERDKMSMGIGCLNPYSNGMRIEPAIIAAVVFVSCLNPYSNGMRIEQASTLWKRNLRPS